MSTSGFARRVVAAAAVTSVSGAIILGGLASAASASGGMGSGGSSGVAGSAIGLYVSAPVLPQLQDLVVGQSNNDGSQGDQSANVASFPANPVLSAGVLETSVDTSSSGDNASTVSDATTADVEVAGIVARGVEATASWSLLPDGKATASTTIGYLKVGNTTLVNYTPPVDDTISLGSLGKIVLNEQLTDGSGEVTVYAVHIELTAINVDVIVSAASIGWPFLPDNCLGLSCLPPPILPIGQKVCTAIPTLPFCVEQHVS